MSNVAHTQDFTDKEPLPLTQWSPGKVKSKFPDPTSITLVNTSQMEAALMESGDKKISVVEGIYLGGKAKEMVNKKTKSTFTSFRRNVKTDDGALVIISSPTQLEGIFKHLEASQDPERAIKKGDRIQVIYSGREAIKKGPQAGKLAHTFSVNKISSGSSPISDSKLNDAFEEEVASGAFEGGDENY